MKMTKKAMISLLSIGGIGLAGAGIGVGYAIHQPQTINHNVEPPQPFWAQLISGFSGTFNINKNDIANIQVKDEKTLLFDYKIGVKTLRYDVNTRDYGVNFGNWQTPLQVFLNKDNIDNIFDLTKYNEGTFQIRIERTEI